MTMHKMTIVLAGFLLLPYTGWTQPTLPLEKYRRLQFPPKPENFTKGWQERVALEYEIINAADLKALRIALKDEDPFVRAIAARALGIGLPTPLLPIIRPDLGGDAARGLVQPGGQGLSLANRLRQPG